MGWGKMEKGSCEKSTTSVCGCPIPISVWCVVKPPNATGMGLPATGVGKGALPVCEFPVTSAWLALNFIKRGCTYTSQGPLIPWEFRRLTCWMLGRVLAVCRPSSNRFRFAPAPVPTLGLVLVQLKPVIPLTVSVIKGRYVGPLVIVVLIITFISEIL